MRTLSWLFLKNNFLSVYPALLRGDMLSVPNKPQERSPCDEIEQ